MPTDYAVNHVEKNIIIIRRTTNEKKDLSGDGLQTPEGTCKTKFKTSRSACFMKPVKFQNRLEETQILPSVLKNKDLVIKLFWGVGRSVCFGQR